MCAEGLSSLLSQAEIDGELTGLAISRGGTRINHLIFADDSVLFCRATIFEWLKIQGILQLYEQASGQQLNREKTSIFFSKNTHPETRAHLMNVAGIGSTQCDEKYLGLPALIGRSRTRSFQNIQSRIWDRLHGWKERFLSQARNEVILKAVIQAIPTYMMSVFQLPKTWCRRINSMMLKFWWGHKDNYSKIAWMSWDKMSQSKEMGGLGFRDLEVFNQLSTLG